MDEKTIKTTLSKLNITEEHWQAAMESKERIKKITTDKGTFWLKKAAPARGIFRYHALNLFSWLLRLPLLKAVPQPGGKQAIANEINRLQSLKNDGVLVPEVWASDCGWLLIGDVGQSIVKSMKQNSNNQQYRRVLLKKCLNAVNSLHQKDQYLSQGFARNMLLDERSEQIAFIDFEDDPLEVMTLAEAQARDLLLLVNSTARFFVDDQEFFQQAVEAFLADHKEDMIKALKHTAERMQWIANIPFQKLFGHDYEKLKVGILALKDL